MSASGYDPAILRNYYEFAAAVAGIENPDVQQTDVQIPYLLPPSRYVDFLNVKYIFVPSWFDSVAGSTPKYKLVMEENKKDYFRLYENTRVFPRFFLRRRSLVYPTGKRLPAQYGWGSMIRGRLCLCKPKMFLLGLPLTAARKSCPR